MLKMQTTLTTLALAAALAAAGGCQQPPESPSGPAPGSSVEVGSVSLHLTLGSTYHFHTVSTDISGNGFHVAADVSVDNSTTFATTVGGIPFGSGYVAKLTALEADDKLTPCEGTATFAVTSATPVAVAISMTCRETAPSTPPSVPVPRGAVVALALLLAALGARRLKTSALALALAGTLVVGQGCVPPPGSDVADTGSIAVGLQVAPGVTVGSVAYTIGGPAGFSRTGTIDTSHSTTVAAVISPLPAGAGYSITLQATTVGVSASCTGSAPFAVTADATTPVMVHLACDEAARKGTAAFQGTVDVCPVAESISAVLTSGGAWELAPSAHDADSGPSPLTYTWTATAGALSDAHAMSPSLTCGAPGAAVVKVTVSDGVCAADVSTTVTCPP